MISTTRSIVEKDVETLEWGLAGQIENPARGHIPDDKQLLLQRMEDEQVRQALERGCDRSNATEVLGVSRRTTFNKIKRANAYDFPLGAFSRGGRPAKDDDDEDEADQRTEIIRSQEDDAAVTQLERGDADDDLAPRETWGCSESNAAAATGTDAAGETDVPNDAETEHLRHEVQSTIDALEAITETL